MGFPLLPILDVAGRVLDRVLPDTVAAEKAKAELALELQKEDVQLALAQVDVNKTEATSSNIWVSGWRPCIGWTCAAAFGYHFILQPFLAFCIVNMGYQLTLPTFDMDTLNTVLMGMLGLGGMRSFDKYKGTAK